MNKNSFDEMTRKLYSDKEHFTKLLNTNLQQHFDEHTNDETDKLINKGIKLVFKQKH